MDALRRLFALRAADHLAPSSLVEGLPVFIGVNEQIPTTDLGCDTLAGNYGRPPEQFTTYPPTRMSVVSSQTTQYHDGYAEGEAL